MQTVFVDIDTQLDFMAPTGALYVPRAEAIIDIVSDLNRWAAGQGITVVSTMDAHAENDPEFAQWPPHCIAGTLGQRKISATLLDRRAVVTTQVGTFDVEGAQQIIIEKQAVDCFTNPNLLPVLDRLRADRYVVYGVVTEICVRLAATGLLRTGKRVEVVTDAVQHLNAEAADRWRSEFVSAGGALISSTDARVVT